MNKAPDFTYAYGRAIRYLSIRPRSIKELKDYFEKKEIGDEISKEVISQLLADKFLGDSDFAKWWARGRKSQGKADFVIRRELEMKGVAKEDIGEALTDQVDDDITVAKTVVARYSRKYAKYSGREYQQKMGNFLARRGFSWEVIKVALSDKHSE